MITIQYDTVKCTYPWHSLEETLEGEQINSSRWSSEMDDHSSSNI